MLGALRVQALSSHLVLRHFALRRECNFLHYIDLYSLSYRGEVPLHSYYNYLWDYIPGVERKDALCIKVQLGLRSFSYSLSLAKVF